ncbi:MAG: hypothetical protein R3D98_08800 [Candidatus Krumholzibacteriia bacterium]
MSPETLLHPLLAPEPLAVEPPVSDALLEELRGLAMGQDQLPARSRQLFEQLRKMLGQERLTLCLLGVQTLAARNEPAGARLLAALLDAQTPGSQLLPRIRPFHSTRRLLTSDSDLVGDVFLGEWQERLRAVVEAAGARADDPPDAADPARPLDLTPLPLLRQTLDGLAPRTGAPDPSADDLRLLAEMVRLECDAYQERVSRLAGAIDPYRVTAVMRALPLLNRADAEIRDLGHLAVWLEAGDVQQAFRHRVPREDEILDESERPRLAAALAGCSALAPLAGIHRRFRAARPSVGELAGPVARLLVLGRALQRAGVRTDELGLVGAVTLVLDHTVDGKLVLELGPELAAAVGRVLMSARADVAAGLRGFELDGERLILAKPQLGLGDRVWRHDLPTLAEMKGVSAPDAAAADEDAANAEPDAAEPEEDTTSAFAVKQLVLNNVGSVSILLGFLRNQKVVSIPGLVAEVARRTRSGRVLEVIAGDRNLHSGHANKDVPRALLESPVNVSVKLLRRFIHVKYVSKTDLRRMARDTSRLRKDVCREIDAYLESLG